MNSWNVLECLCVSGEAEKEGILCRSMQSNTQNTVWRFWQRPYWLCPTIFCSSKHASILKCMCVSSCFVVRAWRQQYCLKNSYIVEIRFRGSPNYMSMKLEHCCSFYSVFCWGFRDHALVITWSMNVWVLLLWKHSNFIMKKHLWN